MHAPVSVVIPCYRCAGTIQRAVDSVLSQTLLPSEIILIDDCSNDEGETLAVLTKLKTLYAEVDIKILTLKENGGPGSARNAGWADASAPYLAFLDSDDSWHPQKISVQYNWMAMHPEVTMSGHASRQVKTEAVLSDLSADWTAHSVSINSLLFSNFLPTRSIMIKKEIPYRFVPGKRYSEDYLLWLTVVNSHSVFFLDLPMAYSFKEEFGDGGLTGNLWKMEKGELDNMLRLYEANILGPILFFLASTFSVIKYIKRLVLSSLRRGKSKFFGSFR